MYQDAYLETEVLSAGPVELIGILYRAALQSLADASEAVRAGDIARRSRCLTRAEAILAELSSALDHEKGGAISRDLGDLYDYMQKRLAQGNFEQTREPIDEVRELMQTLLEGWSGISQSAVASGFAAGSDRPGGRSGANSFTGRRFGGEAAPDQAAGQFSGVDFEHPRLNSLG